MYKRHEPQTLYASEHKFVWSTLGTEREGTALKNDQNFLWNADQLARPCHQLSQRSRVERAIALKRICAHRLCAQSLSSTRPCAPRHVLRRAILLIASALAQALCSRSARIALAHRS